MAYRCAVYVLGIAVLLSANLKAQPPRADDSAAAIRSAVPRAFTQTVSRHIYDSGRFDGICYCSRYGDDVENWAVFEPFTSIRPQPAHQPIVPTSPLKGPTIWLVIQPP